MALMAFGLLRAFKTRLRSDRASPPDWLSNGFRMAFVAFGQPQNSYVPQRIYYYNSVYYITVSKA